MPAGRVEAQQRLDARRDPAGDRHLLLVAARQAPHLAKRRACRSGAGRSPRWTRASLGAHRGSVPSVEPGPRSGSAMFSRTDRCMRSASARFAGHVHEPRADRVGADGRRRPPGRPPRARPRSALRDPDSTSNSSSWPWPSSATTPSTSPGWRSNETSSSLVPAARDRTASRVGSAAFWTSRRGAGDRLWPEQARAPPGPASAPRSARPRPR